MKCQIKNCGRSLNTGLGSYIYDWEQAEKKRKKRGSKGKKEVWVNVKKEIWLCVYCNYQLKAEMLKQQCIEELVRAIDIRSEDNE